MGDVDVFNRTAENIALELFGKGIVPSDAHGYAAKLVVEAHLAPLADKLKASEEALIKANTQETELYVENSQLRIMLHECRPCVVASGTGEMIEVLDKMIGEQHG